MGRVNLVDLAKDLVHGPTAIDGLEEAQRRWPRAYIMSDTMDPRTKIMVHNDQVVAKWRVDLLTGTVKLVMMLKDSTGTPEGWGQG